MEDMIVSTDPEKLDLTYIHGFLSQTYWAQGIPREVVAKSMAHSLCFGLYRGVQQRGFARVITDYATFAYLADVFVDPAEQGQGYGRLLVRTILNEPRLQGLRRWHLLTRDAHGLYQSLEFSPVANPDVQMELVHPPAYR